MPFRPANLVHTDEAALAESTTSPDGSGSLEPGTRSSAGERCLHTADVVGSIPTASTTSPTLPLRLRKWTESREVITVTLSRAPTNDLEAARIRAAIHAFVLELQPKPDVGSQEFFLDRVEFELNTGCWLWTGSLSHQGYGSYYDGGSVRAHRGCYEAFNGAIPDGMGVLHKCDTRACINPAHLFAGTQLDNVRDMSRKGRARHYGTPPLQGSCNRGHTMTPENTYNAPNGRIFCRECRLIYRDERRKP